MLKLWDYECLVCHLVSEQLIDIPSGEVAPLSKVIECPQCRRTTNHDRRMSRPAEYHGEKVHNPVVYGGRFDTAGYRKGHRLPPLPVGEPETINGRTSRGLSFEQLHDYTKANRELIHDNRRIKSENKDKRKRLAALKRGEVVNFRRDKVAGDPKGI